VKRGAGAGRTPTQARNPEECRGPARPCGVTRMKAQQSSVQWSDSHPSLLKNCSRKPNLRGADLRKALIFQSDFYLVDVREALYTPDQEQHLRSCGAILGG
jgi:hypothetical protein